MARPRGVFGAVFAVSAACAPHERPQEPSAPCPAGMAVVGGDAEGALAVGRVCMDITEVTTAAYGACVQAGVCTPAIVGAGGGCNLTRADRGDHPINCASWAQAQTYCGWLGKRLPDDEEWIWAAQGGAAATPYPWGRTPPDQARACWDRKPPGTCPVGSVAGGASPAGILDLIGNAAEWTRGRMTSPLGARGRLRGGSFQDRVYRQPIDERLADSARDEPAEAATTTSGLRCVVAPDTPVQAVPDAPWTPYTPVQGGLPPVLAAALPTDAPVRPLANLAILERPQDQTAVWWAAGDRVLPVAPALAASLGLRAHLQRDVQPAALQGFAPLRWLGETVLMSNQSAYDFKLAAVEPATYRLRWQVAPGAAGRTFEQVVTPRTFVVAYTGESDALAAYALDSGREVWRVRGADDPHFRKIQRVFADGERGYLVGERGLVAFDANTGATLWSGVALGDGCGATAAAGVLVAEDPAGHRVLDPASGQALRTIGRPGGCGWGATSWDRTVALGVVAEGRLLAFDPRIGDDEDADPVATLRAWDLATGAERWRRPRLGTGLLVADHDAVFVARGDHLLALDAAVGATQADITLPSGFALTVQPGGGEAGPLVVVDEGSTGQWLLGRAAAPEPAEAWVVRGRLVAEDYLPRGSAANVPVRVGDRVVRSDARGRFEARGEGRGALRVELGTDRGPDRRGGSKVTFSSGPVILDGSESYALGDIALNEWSLY